MVAYPRTAPTPPVHPSMPTRASFDTHPCILRCPPVHPLLPMDAPPRLGGARLQHGGPRLWCDPCAAESRPCTGCMQAVHGSTSAGHGSDASEHGCIWSDHPLGFGG